jgi:hypothetical protein
MSEKKQKQAQNNGKVTGLTEAQKKAAEVLLGGGSTSQAAQAAGVGQSTIYRWKQKGAFILALRAHDTDGLHRKVKSFSDLVDRGIEVLFDILDSHKESTTNKLRAIRIATQQYKGLTELTELAERLEAIEEWIAEQNDRPGYPGARVN